MLKIVMLPGSLVSSDIFGLNDVTQVKRWKFPAGTSESCPLRVPDVQLGIICTASIMFVYLLSFHIQQPAFMLATAACQIYNLLFDLSMLEIQITSSHCPTENIRKFPAVHYGAVEVW